MEILKRISTIALETKQRSAFSLYGLSLRWTGVASVLSRLREVFTDTAELSPYHKDTGGLNLLTEIPFQSAWRFSLFPSLISQASLPFHRFWFLTIGGNFCSALTKQEKVSDLAKRAAGARERVKNRSGETKSERLIRFAPLAYVPQRQSVPADCFRLRRSIEYQRISPLLSMFRQPLPLSSLVVSLAFP